ncbi:hypothetical protein BBJ28_00004819 [Nothophytophthora sp. Chile5]|nr:hypothetical protein BBJ28_00004819 [Nothophytophthora sp. Chile5]
MASLSPQAIYPPRPFPLSADGKRALESLADQLVAETLHASEDFSAQGRVVDPARWKAVKQKNNMTAYRARKSSALSSRRDRTASADTVGVAASPQMPKLYPADEKALQDVETAPSMTLLDDDDSDDGGCELYHVDYSEVNVLEEARPDRVPLVFSVGVVPGTIEDAALGFLADTELRSRMRNSTSKEVVAEDVRILAQIHGPTRDDPFRFLGIKWCSHRTDGAVGCFVKPRDYVIIESTGLALDSNGERFCYLLNHSIELNEVPDFRALGQVRMTFSACHIVRSVDRPGAVEMFCRGFMDSGGSFSERMCTFMFCDGLLTVPTIVEESYMKKLAWLLLNQQQRFSSGADSALKTLDRCQCCHERLATGVAKLLESTTTCCLCRRGICRKCIVKKTLPQGAMSAKHQAMKYLDFCLDCYLKAKELSAWHVAMATMAVQEEINTT